MAGVQERIAESVSLWFPLQGGSVYLYLPCFCGSGHAISFLITRVHRPEGRAESAGISCCQLSLSNGGRGQSRVDSSVWGSLVPPGPCSLSGWFSILSWEYLPLRQEEPVALVLDLEAGFGSPSRELQVQSLRADLGAAEISRY